MVLRTFLEDGTQDNQKMSNCYQLIKKNLAGTETRPRFEECLKLVWGEYAEDNRDRVFGFISDGESIQPLLKGQNYCIMMNDGKLFDRLCDPLI